MTTGSWEGLEELNRSTFRSTKVDKGLIKLTKVDKVYKRSTKGRHKFWLGQQKLALGRWTRQKSNIKRTFALVNHDWLHLKNIKVYTLSNLKQRCNKLCKSMNTSIIRFYNTLINEYTLSFCIFVMFIFVFCIFSFLNFCPVRAKNLKWSRTKIRPDLSCT